VYGCGPLLAAGARKRSPSHGRGAFLFGQNFSDVDGELWFIPWGCGEFVSRAKTIHASSFDPGLECKAVLGAQAVRHNRKVLES